MEKRIEMEKRLEMDKDVMEKADYVRRFFIKCIDESVARGNVFVTTSFRTDDAMAAVQVLTYAINRLSNCEDAMKEELATAMMNAIKTLSVMQIRHMEIGKNSGTAENAKAKIHDTECRSPFHATVEGMLSTDYKERFKAEYQQTKIRYEKLKAFNTRISAAGIDESVEMPKHDCPAMLLKSQQAAMGEYLHILEVRAVIEGIDL
jgi:hypothetical protein